MKGVEYADQWYLVKAPGMAQKDKAEQQAKHDLGEVFFQAIHDYSVRWSGIAQVLKKNSIFTPAISMTS